MESTKTTPDFQTSPPSDDQSLHSSDNQFRPGQAVTKLLTDLITDRMADGQQHERMHYIPYMVNVLKILADNCSDGDITWVHSTKLQATMNNSGLSINLAMNMLLAHCPDMIEHTQAYIFKKRCARYSLSGLYSMPEFQAALAEDADYLHIWAKNHPTEVSEYYTKENSKKTSANQLTIHNEGTIRVNIGNLLRLDSKTPIAQRTRAIQDILTYAVEPPNADGMVTISKQYVQHNRGGRIYYLASLQTAPNWLKKEMFVTPEEAQALENDSTYHPSNIVNLDIKNCHPSIFIRDCLRHGCSTPELEQIMLGNAPAEIDQKTWKLGRLTALNGGSTKIQADDHEGFSRAITKQSAGMTAEQKQVFSDMFVTVQAGVRKLCRITGHTSTRYYWAVLQQKEQQVIGNLTSILVEHNVDFVNMHDGILITDGKRYDSLGLDTRFKDVRLNKRLEVVNKPL